MPVEEFEARANRLRAEMRRQGMDVLLLYGNGLDECGYPTYVSNYTVKLPFAAMVILPLEGDAILVFEGSTRGRSAAQATTWIEDIRPCWNIAETCVTALAERHSLGAAIGLAGLRRMMPYDQWDLFSAAVTGAKLMDAEPLVDSLRSVKSDREIAEVWAASKIVHTTFDDLEAGCFDAATESLVAARLIRRARMQGAEDVRVMVANPLDPDWAFRPPEDGAIAESETISVLVRASWERYWAEATRTYSVRCGRFEPEWSESDAALFDSIIQRFTPGRSVAELLGELGTACAGNGIGITAIEPPILSTNDSVTILQPGMCLSIRLTLASSVVRGEMIVIETQNANRI
jgi:Xaa-Pro aminopeptidase